MNAPKKKAAGWQPAAFERTQHGHAKPTGNGAGPQHRPARADLAGPARLLGCGGPR